MLVKFKTANLESRVEVDAVPYIGDTISIMDDLYKVTAVQWNIKSGDSKQTVTVSLRPLESTARNES